MTEVYDHTSEPCYWGVLDMPRRTKNKALSKGKGSPPRDKSDSGDIKMAGLFWMISGIVEK